MSLCSVCTRQRYPATPGHEQHPDHDDGLQQPAAPGLAPVRLRAIRHRIAADDVGLGYREEDDDGDDAGEEDQARQGGA
jgi:hypothetical protein